ncbi:MAG: sulfatase-like hydrolase/transferase [bacterium]|nr:sulfatase-like hydrolase/transferase [bacterium]
MTDQPNFLVILSDQHHRQFMGCGTDSLVRTPYLDGLAAQGVQFENTYCASPLCVPSRMTFLSGRHCSDIEVWSNADPLASDIPTFAHALGVAGYESVLGGRMHFVGPDQRHGFECRIIGDALSPIPGGPGPNLGHIPRDTTGQSRRAVEIAGPGRTAYQAYDVAVTDACCDFLEQRENTSAERPFCLVTGYVLPHCPFICPKDLYDEYYDQVEIPRVPEDYMERLHPAIKLWREKRGVNGLSDEAVRKARAAYYGLVTFMDIQIGRLLNTLADTSFAENTVVVYLSDHGEMAGEHGMWWKSSFYEGSVGVPMIWSQPGRFAQRRRISQATSLLDVGPTLIDLAGGEQLPGAAGRSLRGFLEGSGKVADWTDEVISEGYNGSDEPPGRMIRSGPWKLNHYYGYEEPQLFNIKEDPEEFNDRAGDPACADVKAELLARVLEGWDGASIEPRIQRKVAGRQVVRKWAGIVEHDLDGFWQAPPGSNVFPEE